MSETRTYKLTVTYEVELSEIIKGTNLNGAECRRQAKSILDNRIKNKFPGVPIRMITQELEEV